MVSQSNAEFTDAAKILAQGLGERDFIVGNTFTAADILAGHTLNWAYKKDVPLGHSKLERYLDALKQRPAFQRVLDKKPIPFRDLVNE